MASCREVRALKRDEEEIVDSLESADLERLCGEAVERGFVPQDVRKSLESMDWENVPRPRVIRYLLMHVYKSIEDPRRIEENPRPTRFRRWVELLGKYLSSTSVLHKVDHCYAAGATVAPSELAHERNVLASEPSGTCDPTMSGAKRPPVQDIISERHIPCLVEMLIGCAHRWENISIALGLPERVRNDLRSKPDLDCTVSFSQLLTKWVQGGYEHARAPTIQNLKIALSSMIVGLGKEAEKLQGIELSQLMFSNAHPLSSKKSHLERAPLEIIMQSYDTVVPEGKSTLLEVQAITSEETGILHYQWLKYGRQLKNERSNIICINNAGISSKGVYQCAVNIRNANPKSVYTKSISLEVRLSATTEVLLYKYLSKPEVPEDSWPPVGNNTYINLALIKQGSIDVAGEYARSTVQGNMDDILKDKESIEYENTFSNFEKSTRLLIEGRPGSGKTTLVHKFSQDWANGSHQLNLHSIKLLFLVHLRGFFNDDSIKLHNIVRLFYIKESMVAAVTQRAEESYGEGFCFILDGLDEYLPKSMKTTFIYKLIRREELPNAIVIIASRPAASSPFRSIATKQVEVIGFLKEQIFDYVEKYPFSEIGKASDLHKYLKHHPNIHQMCYLPIHVAMVCYLFDVMGSTLPRTETEMYKEFTLLTLLRTLKRDDGEDELEDFESVEDLPDQLKSVFNGICALSYKQTLSSKQVMRRADVKDYFSGIKSGRELLGLVTVDRIAKKYGFENLYTFLHLTFQEYLAAYHLFKMEEDHRLKELEKYGEKQHMQNVWKFFCGLAHFKEHDPKFMEMMKSAHIKGDSLFGVQCAFESQQVTACDYVVQSEQSGTLSFHNHFLTPFDFTAIGYVMKNATQTVEKLVLNRCQFCHKGIDSVLGEAGKKMLSVKVLCFCVSGYDLELYTLLGKCLASLKSLETLDILLASNLCSKSVDCLTNFHPVLPNLHTLKISNRYLDFLSQLIFGSSKIEQIVVLEHYGDLDIKNGLLKCFGSSATFFRSMGSSNEVYFTSHKLELCDVRLVAEGLQRQAWCTSLNLANCCIGDDGCEAVADGLVHCRTLRELVLSDNRIGNRGAVELISKMFKPCTQLERLDLSFNSVDNLGAQSMAKFLEHLNSLRVLDIQCNKLGDDGAIAIARAVSHIKDLILRIWNCGISEVGSCEIKSLIRNVDRDFQHLTITSEMLRIISEVGSYKITRFIHDIHFYDRTIKKEILKEAKILLHITQVDEMQSGNHIKIKLHSRPLEQYMQDDVHRVHKLCHRLQVQNDVHEVHKLCHRLQTQDDVHKAHKLCHRLHTLDYASSYIDGDGARALIESLQHFCCLQTLNLAFNRIGGDGAMAITDYLQHHHSLQTLNLASNSIGDDGVKVLSEGLQHCHSLQTLNLGFNGISDNGTKALSEGLQYCHSLQMLNLESNSISDDGARVLHHECLQHCHSLQTLNLAYNSISNDGARALAESLQHCHSLQTLIVSYNRISNDGARALAGNLQHCHSLQTLDVVSNRIGDDGARALAKALQHCHSLQTLNLGYNSIGDDGARALVEGLQHCHSLQSLNLTMNSISYDSRLDLAAHEHHSRIKFSACCHGAWNDSLAFLDDDYS